MNILATLAEHKVLSEAVNPPRPYCADRDVQIAGQQRSSTTLRKDPRSASAELTIAIVTAVLAGLGGTARIRAGQVLAEIAERNRVPTSGAARTGGGLFRPDR